MFHARVFVSNAATPPLDMVLTWKKYTTLPTIPVGYVYDRSKMGSFGRCPSGLFHNLVTVSSTWMYAGVPCPPNTKMLVPTTADAKWEM